MGRTKKHDSLNCNSGCPVEGTLNLIGGKWKGIILYHLLLKKVLRFNQIQKISPQISQRMLTKQLRDLEGDKLIHRKVYAVIPPKVEYSLTPKGESLESVIFGLRDWGKENLEADRTF